ncbi:PREDICTED: uncharacterized protein LOC106810507 [Priapulus caudatus]|uniref:Uncharacterized protein LOC106810507 n=1 Tax=Priapulus caudatus TaxID=37621 RepID=A0ABM1EB01_PRICU|nr:PREDICTED: uncharacterized protein LOC106810507 [Priapulus caudatus]
MSNLFKFGFTSKSNEKDKSAKGNEDTKKKYEMKRKRGFLPKWLNEYEWLRYDEETEAMFCTSCEKYAAEKSSAFTTTGCLTFRIESLKSHETSSSHVNASKIETISLMKEKKKMVVCSYTGDIENKSTSEAAQAVSGCSNVVGAMDLAIRKLNEDQLQKLSVCFRSAYWIAKNELPFTLYPSVLELQQVNGVELAASYKTDNACRRFMPFIYKDLQSVSEDVLNQSRVLSIMFDGATDVSVCENELVYARVIEDGVPKCVYVKMKAVEHAHAEGVLGAIEGAMSNIEGWKDKLIATGCDGASVNLGKHHSVTALLKRDVPHLIAMHCVNHRLELGVLDALKERDSVIFSDIKSALLHLHKHYHYSAKALRELKSLAEAMEKKMMKPANLDGTRWMPHLSRSLAILLKPETYSVFVTHFENIVESRQGSADVQGRAKNILKHLKCEKLMHYMHFLQDVLEILSDLSLQFQRDTCSIPDVLDAVETACLRLVALQQRPGRHLQGFLDAIGGEHTFQGVELTRCPLTNDQMLAKKNALVETVIHKVSGRLKDLDSSPVLKAMQVFFLVNLPESAADLATYGEDEVATLCDHFRARLERMGCQVDELIQTEWPALKAHMQRNRQHSTDDLYRKCFCCNNLKERFKNILMLVEIILVIPTSSAICERGFSAMARVKSDWRASLQPDMLDYLMAITVSGPPAGEYNSARALNLWYNGGQRQRRPQFEEPGDLEDP